MKIQSIKKAFTLIELLVVITIIGILATWAVSVYTSQIQKARDTTRMSSLKALQSAVEQVYQDSSEYPRTNTFSSGGSLDGTTTTWVKLYIDKIPTDPKHGQWCAQLAMCTYAYWVDKDSNQIAFSEYELSTAFENVANSISKGKEDSWDDDSRLEIWIAINSKTKHNTEILASATKGDWCTKLFDWTAPDSTGTDSIFLAGECN